jgi:hypothetical protein
MFTKKTSAVKAKAPKYANKFTKGKLAKAASKMLFSKKSA